jgi:flagellar protein FlgJ
VAGLLARPATGGGAGTTPLPHGAPPQAYTEGASPAGSLSEIDSFARQIGPSLQWAARQLGVSPRILLAQAALESGWGRALVGNNVFGIKAGSSRATPRISAPTHEIENGRNVAERASFRAYASLDAAVADYVALITGSDRYRAAIGLGDNARAYGEALVRGGYATDGDYAEKLAAVAASPSLETALAALPQPSRPLSAASAG